MVTEPQEATRPSSLVSMSPRTWIRTSAGPILKPPAGSGTASFFVEVYCDIEGGGVEDGSASAADAAGGSDGSGPLATSLPRAVRAISGATGGAAAVPGVVATQFALSAARGGLAGFAVSSVSPFFPAALSSIAGVKGCSTGRASEAPSATDRM